MRIERVLCLLISIGAALPAGAVEPPLTVSPGSGDAFLGSPSACPPMSWTLVEGARGYELAVFAMPKASDSDPVLGGAATAGWESRLGEPLLRQVVPAGANHWLPAVDQCLPAGGRYVWAVRAEGPDGWSDWSRPSFFTAPGGATWWTPVARQEPAVPPAAVETAGPEDVVFTADGLIESTSDGFRFPDGGEQKKAFTREVFHVQVAANGTQLAGNVSSTAKGAATGQYSVTLPRLGIGCSVVGNGSVYDPPGGVFSFVHVNVVAIVEPSSLTIDISVVETSSGAAIDADFQLVIVCPPFVLF